MSKLALPSPVHFASKMYVYVATLHAYLLDTHL